MTVSIAEAREVTPASQSALDRSLIHGIAWSGGIKWFGQIVTWLSTLVVVHLLAPSDYGLIAMATMYLSLVTLITEFGVGTAVVTLPDLSTNQIGQLNTVSVLLGSLGFLTSLLVARPLGYFFSAPNLPPAIAVMSVAFVTNSFKTVPAALLQKDLRFKLLSGIEGLAGLVLAVAVVVFAFLGWGYWALVFANVLNAVLGTAMVLFVRRHSFAKPNLASLHHVLRFSWHILVSRICWYSYSNADFVIAGRMLGQTMLGVYSIGWTLANVPVEKISSLIGGVTPAFFSAVQSELSVLRRYLLNLTEGISLITFPLSIGMALVVNDFVFVALGPKWQAAAPSLRLLALYASLRSITPLLPQILNVTGESKYMMWNTVFTAILLPVGFYCGAHWGITGIAAAWMLAYPVVTIPLYRRVFKAIDMRPTEYLQALEPAIMGVSFMAVAVIALGYLLPAKWSAATHLVSNIICGVLVYVCYLWLKHGDRLKAIYRRVGPGQAVIA